MDKDLKDITDKDPSKDQTPRVEDVQKLEDAGMNLCRRPSLLDLISDRRLGLTPHTARSSSRATCHSYDENDFDAAVLQWDSADIDSWLEEIGMGSYDYLFRQQDITTGRRLLSLTEEQLKEIGKSIITVGHRLELSFQIDELRKAAGWVSRAGFVDIPTLLNQLVFIITCK